MGCSYQSVVLTSLHRAPLGQIIQYIQQGTQETIFNGIGQFQVTGWVYEGQKEMLQIQTQSGRIIVVSEDQSFANKFDTDYESILSSNLQVGESILVIGHYTTVWKEPITSITPVGLADSYNLYVEANHPYPCSWFPIVPEYQPYTPEPPQSHNQGAQYGMMA